MFSCHHSQFLEGKKFVETTRWMDLKIVIYAISVFLGYYSHLVCKFPKDWQGVLLSLLAYAVLMTIHYYIENYQEKGAFFISSSHQVSSIDNPSCSVPNPSLSVQMSKFMKWQKMKWYSEVVIADDNKSAVYELRIEA